MSTPRLPEGTAPAGSKSTPKGFGLLFFALLQGCSTLDSTESPEKTGIPPGFTVANTRDGELRACLAQLTKSAMAGNLEAFSAGLLKEDLPLADRAGATALMQAMAGHKIKDYRIEGSPEEPLMVAGAREGEPTPDLRLQFLREDGQWKLALPKTPERPEKPSTASADRAPSRSGRAVRPPARGRTPKALATSHRPSGSNGSSGPE